MIGENVAVPDSQAMEYAFNWESETIDVGDEVANSANNELRFSNWHL